jgi:photosystem II stability/assembly factor-like uncharacterized protein
MPPSAAPAAHWVNATGNLAGTPSGCEGIGKIAAQPCSSRVIAGLEGHGLWATDDSGKSWRALGVGAGSASITNTAHGLVFDPTHPDVFWETGIRGTSGLYKTTDGGSTFKQLGALSFTQLVSVDFSDPDRKILVTGTHGMKQQAFRSTDGGGTWTNVGLNLPASANNSESPLVIDSKTFLLGACDQSANGCGIHRTADGGATWSLTNDVPVSHFGAPLWASDGSIYWPLVNDGGMSKSTDLGLTWTQIASSGTMFSVTPLELPDGSIVEVGVDYLLRSTDHGKTWLPILDPLPFKLVGDGGSLTYSTGTKTFFLAHFDCGASQVLPDGIMSAGFEYAAK